jgi:hypothetical protein
MASVTDWLYMLAEIRALYDLGKSGSDYSASVLKYRSEMPASPDRSRAVGKPRDVPLPRH